MYHDVNSIYTIQLRESLMSYHQRMPRMFTLLLLSVLICTGTVFADDDIPTNDEGQRHGRVTLEHSNGELYVQAAYRDGQLSGAYREFNESGQIILQSGFREGRLHGRLNQWTDSGERLVIARYRDGELEGVRQVFSGGEIALTETYENGERVSQEGDASADPGPPVFAVDVSESADTTIEPGPGNAPPDAVAPGARPPHQQDTSQRPAGYPASIDDLARAFSRIDTLRIEGSPDEQQAIAIRHLIKYRLLCGIADPIVAFDSQEATLAQRACEVCHALGRLSHEPPNPGLPEDVYRQGADGAKRSNLGSGAVSSPMTSIERWMIDSGDNNRDEVGHRRWCLVPGLYETAYGYHEGFGSLLVVGNTRDHVPYDHLAFPGHGYQPVEFYDHRAGLKIWSLHLNPDTYTTPESEQQISVTVTRVLPDGSREGIDIGRVHFAEKAIPLDAILFEPELSQIEAGAIYEVQVRGLERRRRPYTLTYRVEFYELGE